MKTSLFALLLTFTLNAAQPPGCNTCNLVTAPACQVIETPNGSIAYFGVRIGNPDSLACDQTNLTVHFACPGPMLGTFGPTNLLRTGLNLPAGTPPQWLTNGHGSPVLVPCLVLATNQPGLLKAFAFATNNAGGCQLSPTSTANAFGTASLTVYDRPHIITATNAPNHWAIACATVPGTVYTLEGSTDPLTGYAALATFTASNRVSTVIDSTQQPQRYYRLMSHE